MRFFEGRGWFSCSQSLGVELDVDMDMLQMQGIERIISIVVRVIK